jgi:2-(1,2-epoxy-1,2-dihydrophenyl)acetyl-CoA isomerase
MELCFTGDKIPAAEALRIGLVNQVVPHEELMPKTMELAHRLAKMPTKAIGLTKRLLIQSATNDLSAQLEAEAFAQETAGGTKDHFEGVTAFLAKRQPTFEGS